MSRDDCTCGMTKDRRAVQCRSCFRKEPSEKLCRGCGVSHQIGSYSLRPNGRGGFKRRSRCKPCEANEARRHRALNPGRVRRTKRAYNESHRTSVRRWARRSHWRKKGLNPDEVERLLACHSGKCEICKRHQDKVRTLHADHCHYKGLFRGFICSSCNIGLGHFKHSVERLRAAIKYLKTKNGRVLR